MNRDEVEKEGSQFCRKPNIWQQAPGHSGMGIAGRQAATDLHHFPKFHACIQSIVRLPGYPPSFHCLPLLLARNFANHPPNRPLRLLNYLHMNRSSFIRNHRLQFKTSRKLPIVSKEFTEYMRPINEGTLKDSNMWPVGVEDFPKITHRFKRI